MIQRILVLGGGSAGFLAASTLKRKLPGVEVALVRSEQIGIIGVGEGTTFTVPIYLHGYLGVDPKEFHRAVQPTYKLGVRFLWGPQPRFHYTFTTQLDARYDTLARPNGYYCRDEFDYADLTGALMAQDLAFERQADGGPLVGTHIAYHLENRQFVEYLEQFARGLGVQIYEDTLQEAIQNEQGIERLRFASGREEQADLYIDCSGFRSELLHRTFAEEFIEFDSTLFCDRAVVGGWAREDEILKPYTTAETMDSGWAWQIEHDRFINRGYVYSSNFISDDQAEQEFRGKNPKVEQTRVVKFISGRYRRAWVKNVVAIGNAAGFVEPLEATSLAVICDHSATLANVLIDSQREIRPWQATMFNRHNATNWDAIRRFLALHYKFNTRLSTPFWEAARADTDIVGAEEIVDYFQENGPSLIWARQLMGDSDPFNWEGYLMMLVGQQVAYKADYQPTAEERSRWQGIQQRLARRAQGGMPLAEALAAIRSDAWGWRPDFYTSAVRW